MKRCLIVDDSKIIRVVVRKIMQDFGFDVDEAENGAKAATKCAEVAPDVVLLDWSLPGDDGISVLRQIKSRPEADQTVILFCTTKSDQAHVQEALDAGAFDYVIKPFDAETIHQKLSSASLI